MSLRVKTLSAIHRGIYSATGGRVGNRIAGMPVLLLTTVGRKTGKRRTSPLTYFEEDGAIVLVASYGGRPHNPAWFENLIAAGEGEVTIGRERRQHAGAEGDRRRARPPLAAHRRDVRRLREVPGEDAARDPARRARLAVRHPRPEVVEHGRGVGPKRGAGERERARGEDLRATRRFVVRHLSA